MSKKFRTLVGAIISASICSSCTSSGLPNSVKWAVGVPMVGALVYCGGRKLGFWEANRRGKVSYIGNMRGSVKLLGDSNDDDDDQPSNEEKVAKLAGEIEKLVGPDNYNVLEEFYKLEKENLGNSGKPVGSKLASEGLILSASGSVAYIGSMECKSVGEVKSFFTGGGLVGTVSELLGDLFKHMFVLGDVLVSSEECEQGSGFKFFADGVRYKFLFSGSDVSIKFDSPTRYECTFEFKLSKP